jgi:hypothetical protein
MSAMTRSGAILVACTDAISGTDGGAGSNEPVGGMLDIADVRCLFSG